MHTEMWLKLEFPLAGEAKKQESQGRGQSEREETNGSQFTQAKGFHSSSPMFFTPPYSLWAQTHTSREDRLRHETPLNSYKEITTWVCASACEKSVSVRPLTIHGPENSEHSSDNQARCRR